MSVGTMQPRSSKHPEAHGGAVDASLLCDLGHTMEIAKAAWHLGHADPPTTKLYDRRGYNSEKSARG